MTRQHSPVGRDHGGRSRRNISVRSVRRAPGDYQKFARALIALVEAEAEAAAEAAGDAAKQKETSGSAEDAA